MKRVHRSISGKDEDDFKRKVREHFASQFAADGVTPDEVVLKDNGDVVIDRRSKFPRAVPMVVGDWSKRQ